MHFFAFFYFAVDLLYTHILVDFSQGPIYYYHRRHRRRCYHYYYFLATISSEVNLKLAQATKVLVLS